MGGHVIFGVVRSLVGGLSVLTCIMGLLWSTGAILAGCPS